MRKQYGRLFRRWFLSIGDVMRSCGISRSSLIRLEQRGLITPHRIPHNGRRYYTAEDVDRINQLRTPRLVPKNAGKRMEKSAS